MKQITTMLAVYVANNSQYLPASRLQEPQSSGNCLQSTINTPNFF